MTERDMRGNHLECAACAAEFSTIRELQAHHDILHGPLVTEEEEAAMRDCVGDQHSWHLFRDETDDGRVAATCPCLLILNQDEIEERLNSPGYSVSVWWEPAETDFVAACECGRVSWNGERIEQLLRST